MKLLMDLKLKNSGVVLTQFFLTLHYSRRLFEAIEMNLDDRNLYKFFLKLRSFFKYATKIIKSNLLEIN